MSRRLKDLGAWVRDQNPSEMTRYDYHDYGQVWIIIMDHYGLWTMTMDYDLRPKINIKYMGMSENGVYPQ